MVTAELKAAEYCKLRDGSWGLRVLVADVRPGEVVEVRTKHGRTHREVVGRVIWRGDGVALATKGDRSNLPPREAPAAPAAVTPPPAPAPEPVPEYAFPEIDTTDDDELAQLRSESAAAALPAERPVPLPPAVEAVLARAEATTSRERYVPPAPFRAPVVSAAGAPPRKSVRVCDSCRLPFIGDGTSRVCPGCSGRPVCPECGAEKSGSAVSPCKPCVIQAAIDRAFTEALDGSSQRAVSERIDRAFNAQLNMPYDTLEASGLGFRVGEWPDRIYRGGVVWHKNEFPVRNLTGDIDYFVYTGRVEGGVEMLHVYNT